MNTAVLLVVIGLLTIGAVVIGFLLGAEVVRLVRDLFAPPQVRGQYMLDSNDVAESGTLATDKTRRNRATVERLITAFEDKDPRSVPGTKES